MIIKKKLNIVGTVSKSNRKLVERGKIDTPNSEIHEGPLTWTVTSIQSDGINN